MRKRNYIVLNLDTKKSIKIKPAKVTSMFGHLSKPISRLCIGESYENCKYKITCIH